MSVSVPGTRRPVGSTGIGIPALRNARTPTGGDRLSKRGPAFLGAVCQSEYLVLVYPRTAVALGCARASSQFHSRTVWRSGGQVEEVRKPPRERWSRRRRLAGSPVRSVTFLECTPTYRCRRRCSSGSAPASSESAVAAPSSSRSICHGASVAESRGPGFATGFSGRLPCWPPWGWPGCRRSGRACARQLGRSDRSSPGQHRLAGPEEHPEVEPERPVLDVIAVGRLVLFHVAVAAVGHLPVAADPGLHLAAEVQELRLEAGEVIVRERTRTHEAHLAGDDVPDLGQLVDARAAQERPDERDDARVAPQLHRAAPLLARADVELEVLVQPPL